MSDKEYVFVSNTMLLIAVFIFIATFDSFWFCLLLLFWKSIEYKE